MESFPLLHPISDLCVRACVCVLVAGELCCDGCVQCIAAMRLGACIVADLCILFILPYVSPVSWWNCLCCVCVQASTSELYGKVQEIPQTETTPFYPRSPYGELECAVI